MNEKTYTYFYYSCGDEAFARAVERAIRMKDWKLFNFLKDVENEFVEEWNSCKLVIQESPLKSRLPEKISVFDNEMHYEIPLTESNFMMIDIADYECG